MKRAFTLIELLTVISIVVALAAVTFAVFGPVKRAAQGSVCANNMRQLHVGYELYRHDWDTVGAYTGSASAMGYPAGNVYNIDDPQPEWRFMVGTYDTWKCPHPKRFGHDYWPGYFPVMGHFSRIDSDGSMLAPWLERIGGRLPVVSDINHNDASISLHDRWVSKRVLYVTLDGSFVSKSTKGVWNFFPHLDFYDLDLR
ncbi:MAG: type II secretion system protein [Fimbriimonadaceae bacterium]|nr:type II secretion system protein [Fimbriimonadaceae bacterium]